MFGWFASLAPSIGRCMTGPTVQRRWSRLEATTWTRYLPLLGNVLYLPEKCGADYTDSMPKALLAGRPELAPLLQAQWLACAAVIGEDGPREWLECVDSRHRLRARLHLLPDSDYLAWDAFSTAGVPTATLMPKCRYSDFRPDRAYVLRFKCRQLAGLTLLDGDSPAPVSSLGCRIARQIAQAESVELRLPVPG